jgi:hypothetical protein
MGRDVGRATVAFAIKARGVDGGVFSLARKASTSASKARDCARVRCAPAITLPTSACMRDRSLCRASIALRSVGWGGDFMILLLWPFRRERNRSLSHRARARAVPAMDQAYQNRRRLRYPLLDRRVVGLKPATARLFRFSN